MRLWRGSETATASRASVIMGPSALSRIPFWRCSGGVMSATNTLLHLSTDPVTTSSTYRILLGKFSLKTRGSMAAESCVARMSLRMCVLWRYASGVSRSSAYPARAVPSAANANTGAITVRLETPAARMATISPSAAIRPSPIRIPTSTPNGMVNGSTGGSVHPSSASTVPALTLFELTSAANSLSAYCKKMMNVASSVPSSALSTTSRKTYLPRRRNTGFLLHRLRRDQFGRRHHRQLGQLFLNRTPRPAPPAARRCPCTRKRWRRRPPPECLSASGRSIP